MISFNKIICFWAKILNWILNATSFDQYCTYTKLLLKMSMHFSIYLKYMVIAGCQVQLQIFLFLIVVWVLSCMLCLQYVLSSMTSLTTVFLMIWTFVSRRAVLLWCKHSLNVQRALTCQVKDMVSLSLMAVMLCVSVSVWQDVSQERWEQLCSRTQVDGSQHNSTSVNDALENRRGEGLKINSRALSWTPQKCIQKPWCTKILPTENFEINFWFLAGGAKSLTETVMFN